MPKEDKPISAGLRRYWEYLELERKAAAYDRLSQWLHDLNVVGIGGAPVSPSEIRAILEGLDAK